MIKDLRNFGEWLNQNNQVDFGKNVNENDYILTVAYENESNFFLKSISSKCDSTLNYFEKSIFNRNLLISTDQSFMIPNNTNLLGFSPFFIKLGKYKEAINETNFKKKIKKSLKDNKNNKEFIKFIDLIFGNFNEFFDKYELDDSQKEILNLIEENLSKNEVKNLIIKYYSFILENSANIVNMIKNYKDSDESFDTNRIIYLACIFGDYNDLINDFCFICSDFYKLRNEKITDDENGICAICGKEGITYPNFPYFLIDENFSFNYTKKDKFKVKNSKLKLCNECNRFIKHANDKLFSRIINIPYIAIIPKIKTGDYVEFLEISNEEINNFKKINKFLKKCDDFIFDLIIYKWNDKKTNLEIKRYIENYEAYLIRFENLYLYNNNKMNYLFNETIFLDSDPQNKIKNKISSTFDFENIFKEFFCFVSNDKLQYPNLNYFYQIFTKDLTGNDGIFKGDYNSKIVSLFSRFSENIFSFIYEVNLDILNKKMINDIVLNSLLHLEKNKYNIKISNYQFLKRLNYYYFIKKEILGDFMLSNSSINKLKTICEKYDEKGNVIFEQRDTDNILDLIENDNALKYYLLGQFIKLIDNTKGMNEKNANVFSNFVGNANRNNIKKLFITEILQKNIFYIDNMNKKGKVIFNFIESDIDNLFNEGIGFDYEDYILLLFTGYYTDCVLSSSYNNKNKNNEK